MTYQLDVLIPTARFVFSVEGDGVEVLAEHRSPEAFVEYRELRDRRPVVGMTTFPNTVLLRGPRTIVVDPGLPLQNDPVLRALEARGLSAADVDLVVLTHAHLDHAGGCASLMAPVVVHELETQSPYWVMSGGVLELLPLERLSGDAGELAPGVEWALTPGHCDGHISLAVQTDKGRAVLCGDTIGPGRQAFDAMQQPDGPEGPALLQSWRRIRDWRPDLIVAGHLPPFAP
ncbi:MAG TPA: MBL fold metallo-hydrolase [Thermoleophilia bacterium]|nr:MBL fold metallo-hydrolase [Thermoleophilia bacterium]